MKKLIIIPLLMLTLSGFGQYYRYENKDSIEAVRVKSAMRIVAMWAYTDGIEAVSDILTIKADGSTKTIEQLTGERFKLFLKKLEAFLNTLNN